MLYSKSRYLLIISLHILVIITRSCTSNHEACNKIFECGLLCHMKIYNSQNEVLSTILILVQNGFNEGLFDNMQGILPISRY